MLSSVLKGRSVAKETTFMHDPKLVRFVRISAVV